MSGRAGDAGMKLPEYLRKTPVTEGEQFRLLSAAAEQAVLADVHNQKMTAADLAKHKAGVLPGSDDDGVEDDDQDVEEEQRKGDEEDDAVPSNTDKAKSDPLVGNRPTSSD